MILFYPFLTPSYPWSSFLTLSSASSPCNALSLSFPSLLALLSCFDPFWPLLSLSYPGLSCIIRVAGGAPRRGPAKRGTATAETRKPGRGAGRGRSRGKCRSAGRGRDCPRPRKCWHGESSDPSRRRGQGLCVLCQQKEERRPWRLLRLQVQAALGPTDKAQLFEMVCQPRSSFKVHFPVDPAALEVKGGSHFPGQT